MLHTVPLLLLVITKGQALSIRDLRDELSDSEHAWSCHGAADVEACVANTQDLSYVPLDALRQFQHANQSMPFAAVEPRALFGADRCTREIVMLDSRDLAKSVVGLPFKYVTMAALINYLYAEKLGYKFRYVKVDENRRCSGWSDVWHRPFYFADRLAKQRKGGCSQYLHVDSDAFISSRVSMDEEVAWLRSAYNIPEDWGAIMSEETHIDGTDYPENKWASISPAVMLVQGNEHGFNFLKEWIQAGTRAHPFFRTNWPAEMGVVTELLRPGRYLRAHVDGNYSGVAKSVGVVGVRELQSPWGNYTRHFGGKFKSENYKEFWNALVSALGGKSELRKLPELLRRVHVSVEDWGCDDIGSDVSNLMRS